MKLTGTPCERRPRDCRARLWSASGGACSAAGVVLLLAGAAPGLAWSVIVVGLALTAFRPSAANGDQDGWDLR